MKTPRQISIEALMQVAQRGAWSNIALDHLLQKYDLERRDSSFVGALFYGVLERMVTLDACIAAHIRQPLEKLSPAVLATLRAGIYQLLYMDGVPDHAAVAESVEVIKHLRKAQAAGFVNGVLRSFLRSGKQIPIPSAPPAAALSVEFSCPQPLVELWLAGYGEPATRRILAGSLGRPPLYLRVNTQLITPLELTERLAAHGIAVIADPDLAACLLIADTGAVAGLPEYRRGFFHVQDKSSQLCAAALDAQPGMRVLDACSAPGGKAFTLMQLMQGRGEIVAADLHAHRTKLIAERAKAMKLAGSPPLGGIHTVTADMAVHDPGLGLFDRVLCDAPCSGLGVIRRKPEIKFKPPEEFAKLPAVQYKILENTAQYCQAGGMLLYSTCTLNPAENEAVADRFSQAHPEFVHGALPELLGGGHRRTILDELDADGFFLAVWRRKS